jgi:hypothetical protein
MNAPNRAAIGALRTSGDGSSMRRTTETNVNDPKTMGRPKAAQGTTHTSHDSKFVWIEQRAHRLRLAARCLGLHPVFVDDGRNLAAELFDASGDHVETWCWSIPGAMQ